MKILELMHTLEECYDRFGDLDVFVEENTFSTRSPEKIVSADYDSESFIITRGKFKNKQLID